MVARVNRNQCFFLATVPVDWVGLAQGLDCDFFRSEKVSDGIDLLGTSP